MSAEHKQKVINRPMLVFLIISSRLNNLITLFSSKIIITSHLWKFELPCFREIAVPLDII